MPVKLGYYRAGDPIEIWITDDDTGFCMVTYVTDLINDPRTTDMLFMGYVTEFSHRH